MQKFLYLAAAFLLLPFFISAQPVVTSATRVKLFKGDSIFTAPLSGLASAIGAGGNRPDSAWATGPLSSPVYWGKGLSSNIIRRGKVSVNTQDTFALFNLLGRNPVGSERTFVQNIVSPPRSAFSNNAFANGSFFDLQRIDINPMKPNHFGVLNYGLWTDRVNVDSTTNLAVNKPGNSIRNVGFNTDGEASWLPKWYWSTEQAYYPGAGNSGGLDWEYHLEVVDTLNRLTRPFNLNGSHNGNKYSAGFRVNEFYVGRPYEESYGLRIKLNTGEWSTDRPFTFKINNSTRIGRLIDRLHWGGYKNVLDFETNGRLAVGDSAGIKILNRLEFNRVNAGGLKIISKTDPNITIDSTMLTINSTDINNRFLILTKPGTSNAIGFALSNTEFYIEADYATRSFVLSRTAPSNSLVVSSTGRVGLGISNPFSAIDVVQPTNELSGGILLRPTTGNYCGMFVDGNNRVVFNRGGSDRLYLSNSGQLTIPSYNSVSSYPITPAGVLGFDANGVIGTIATGASLPSGTSTQTLRYDGTNTLVATSQITNDGATVGIGTAPNASYELDVAGKTRAQGLRAEGTTMQPSLELANTTPTTGKTFTLGSSNTGNFFISSDVAGDAIAVAHATGDVTITPKLKINTFGTTATALLGRNAGSEVSEVTLGSGLSLTAGTLSATDASTTNELQTLSNTSDATSHTATLSNSGGSLKLVEGSNITLATTGTGLDGIVTISATGGGSSPVIITPSAITVDQNNYSPTDWSTATIVRISGTTQIWGITGFSSSGFSGGHTKRIINVGAKSIYFAGEHPSSTAANRISATNDFVLGAKKSMNIVWDATLSRWIIEGTERVPEIEHNWSAASQTGSEFENVAFSAIGTGTVNTGGNAATDEPAATKISTGTTSSGGGSITLGKTVAPIATRLGHKYVEGYFTVLSTSNASNRYTAGLIISTTTTGTFAAANTCGVRYTDNVNGGRWELYSINNGGTTVTQDLGITVSSAPTKIRIEMDDAGATIRAYVNEEMKGQISGAASLPTEFGNYFGKLQIIKSVGTTAVIMDCYSMKSGIHTY